MTTTIGCVRFVSALTLTLFLLDAAHGKDSVNLYTERTQSLAAQSYDKWQRGASGAHNATGSIRIKSGGGTKASAAAHHAALREYLSKLVPEMKPSTNVAHIPREHPIQVDIKNPDKKWTKYYTKAKNSLRPNIEYEWNSNAARHREMITLSDEHIETLRANFDILMWYRNEMDLKASGEEHRGANRFKLFLDHFVAGLLDGLPAAPKIDLKTGKVAGDQWDLDERNLREQLIMAYRYLVAKHHVYEEYDEFGPADRELLDSMMKISFLVGAHMNPDWFQEMDVNLKAVNQRTQWKKPIVDALEVLQDEVQDTSDYEQPCVIAIPPPKPKKVVPKPQPAVDGQKVEIIIRSKP